MGWLHAGTNGVDFRSEAEKAEIKAQRQKKHAEERAKDRKEVAARDQAAKKMVEEFKKNPPTKKEIEAYIAFKQEEALNYISRDSKEFPTQKVIKALLEKSKGCQEEFIKNIRK